MSENDGNLAGPESGLKPKAIGNAVSAVQVTAPIRIRGLRLSGPRRDYVVDFTGDDEGLKPLALIAGEISTGKSTVLEFIDYCLGAGRHPEHEEIIDSVRTAQLAIEVLEYVTNGGSAEDKDDDAQPIDPILADTSPQVVRYVIERRVGVPSSSAMLFQGDHWTLLDLPPRRLTLDPADADSISQFLLRACGMAGLRTREAPTQEESKTHILSFRDVMPLCFLTNRRLDNGDLVLENTPPRTLKLRQVVDYFFGVSDEEASTVAAQIDQLRMDLRTADASLKSLRSFLLDAGVPDEFAIDVAEESAQQDRRRVAQQLSDVSARLEASTAFAEDARNSYHDAATRARIVTGQVRERDRCYLAYRRCAHSTRTTCENSTYLRRRSDCSILCLFGFAHPAKPSSINPCRSSTVAARCANRRFRTSGTKRF